jgi:hypothetical protein
MNVHIYKKIILMLVVTASIQSLQAQDAPPAPEAPQTPTIEVPVSTLTTAPSYRHGVAFAGNAGNAATALA